MKEITCNLLRASLCKAYDSDSFVIQSACASLIVPNESWIYLIEYLNPNLLAVTETCHANFGPQQV